MRITESVAMDNVSMSDKQKARISLVRLNTKDMTPHPIAQRDFIPEHAHKIAKSFSWDKYDPIEVSFRDGKYWIIDGQHRRAAIIERFHGDITVLCRVFYGMTVEDEAVHFIQQNKGIVTVKLRDILRVKYKTGDPEVTDAVMCARIAGWEQDGFTSDYAKGKLTAHSTLMALHKRLPREQYIDLLKVLYKAWDGDPHGACREILRGMECFYTTYWGEFDSKVLARKLSQLTPDMIVRDGRSVNTRNRGGIPNGVPYARAILRQYNYGAKKYVLPDKL